MTNERFAEIKAAIHRGISDEAYNDIQDLIEYVELLNAENHELVRKYQKRCEEVERLTRKVHKLQYKNNITNL